MGFLKAKYCVPFFMLVLLTSGVPLNANNDGDILPTVNAQTIDNGNKKQYYDFGKCNIYDNLLIKTNNGDNIQGKILHIDDNIL